MASKQMKKRPAKKRTAKKRTTKKRTAKKRPAKKRPAKKKSTKKKSTKKKSTKKKSTKKKSTKEKSRARGNAVQRARAALVDYALGLPEAWRDRPWGETVAKVRKKVFVFFGTATDGQRLGFSVKLPESGDVMLAFPFAKPTGYGLGKSGWVSMSLAPADLPSQEVLQSWVDESYVAVAPKKLGKQLLEHRSG